MADMKTANQQAVSKSNEVWSSDYSTLMTNIKKTQINAAIKAKLTDVANGNPKAYEEIPCNHKPEDPTFKKLDCQRCKMNRAAIWLEDYLRKLDGTETVNAKPITKIEVQRGKYDDVIGILVYDG